MLHYGGIQCALLLGCGNCCWCGVGAIVLVIAIQFSAMDVLVQATMKGAAKCDKLCELQNSVNQQNFERVLCFWDIPESMPELVSFAVC